MKIAIINDTHSGARGENPHVDAHFFRFWDGVFFPYLKEHGITTVFHLGDVVDRRKYINFKTLHTWRTKFFEPLKEYDVHILLGNHDIFHKNTSEVNAIDEILGHYHNVTIYRDARDLTIDGLTVAMIPWINEENEERTKEFLTTTRATIAFGHLEIAGFEMDKGYIAQEGLSKDLFRRFAQVYTGHFHHRSNDGHIFYLGNQYQITWVDYDDPRGFHVFDTDTQTIEFIENPHILFHKIVYNDEIHTQEYWKTFDFTRYKNTYVKVVVENKKNPYLFDITMETLQKQNPIDVMIVEDFTDPNANTDPALINQSEDIVTILSNYIDTQKFEVPTDRLKTIMKDLYFEALTTDHTA